MSNSKNGWGTSIANALSELITGEKLFSEHQQSKPSLDYDDDYWDEPRSDDNDDD
jgi:hypothetical protein